MSSWLWSQISANGVFSIEALSKSVLAFYGLVALGGKAVAWKRGKRNSQHATLELYCRDFHNYHQFGIQNTSNTAVATNVVLYFDGVPYSQHDANFNNDEHVPDLPPGHMEVINFVTSMDKHIERVHVTWTDRNGSHSTTPAQPDALPEF